VQFPNKGDVEGAKLQELVSLLTSLSDETKIAKLIQLFDSAQTGVQVDQSLVDEDDPTTDIQAVTDAADAGAETYVDFVAKSIDLDPVAVVPGPGGDFIDGSLEQQSVVAANLPHVEAAVDVEEFCL
jgi:hypothetical protein